MVDFLISFCTSVLLCSLYVLFRERKKRQQTYALLLITRTKHDISFSNTRRALNLSILRTAAHSGALYTEINRERRIYTPVMTGPQSYPSRQAYLRRRLVIAQQSYRALLLGLPNLILEYAHYLHHQRR